MKQEREGHIKYKKLSIQEKTSEEIDRKICGALWDKESSVKEYSKVEATSLNKDSSSGKC